MSTELWSALGTIIATLVLLVIPSIVFAYVVLEILIDDPDSYEHVMAAVEEHTPSA
jgi:hypothetical protein